MSTGKTHLKLLVASPAVLGLIANVLISQLVAGQFGGLPASVPLLTLPPVESEVSGTTVNTARSAPQAAPTSAGGIVSVQQPTATRNPAGNERYAAGNLVDLRMGTLNPSGIEKVALKTPLEQSDYLVEKKESTSEAALTDLSSYVDCCDPGCKAALGCDPGCDAALSCDPGYGCGPAASMGSDCCSSQCCNGNGCCNGACCNACCGPPCYWLAGVEATFFGPNLNTGFVSYQIQDQFPAVDVNETFGSEDIAIDDFYVAPRLWLGAQYGCWGVVGRYWHMQAAEAAFDPFTFTPPGPTPDFGYFIHNRFEAYTIDLELTRSFCCYDTKNTVSFGTRYASILHDNALSVDGQVNNGAGGLGVISGNARSNRSAHGTGITGSWQGRRPFFCNSCLHLFYGTRGSVVWGPISNSVETDTIEITTGATAGSYNGAVTLVNDALFIVEGQLGLQVDYRVACFPADAFFRIAAEYQYWSAEEGTTVATSFAGFGGPSPAPFSQGQAFAAADGLSLDLIGLTIGTGFTW